MFECGPSLSNFEISKCNNARTPPPCPLIYKGWVSSVGGMELGIIPKVTIDPQAYHI